MAPCHLPVVLAVPEEVSVAVAVLHHGVDAVGDAVPVGDGTRVTLLHWRVFLRVKLPII